MAPWATRDGVGFDVLDRVQDSLTVDMIMTHRHRLMTCRPEDRVDAIMARNTDRFSFLPVEDADGRIDGLYKADHWFDKPAPRQPIGDDFETLSEDMVLGADASILEFVKTADERQARLVVHDDEVIGLITLSDLQQLPVRAALFTLLTSFEMVMAKRIEAEWPSEPDGWLKLLCPKRRKSIRRNIRKAKQNDGFVSEIVSTQFSDKAAIIEGRALLSGCRTALECDFSSIRDLRNNIAHANYYAETPKAARGVCAVVRTILEIGTNLSEGAESGNSSTNCDASAE